MDIDVAVVKTNDNDWTYVVRCGPGCLCQGKAPKLPDYGDDDEGEMDEAA